jgi:hypothetical protein
VIALVNATRPQKVALIINLIQILMRILAHAFAN